MNGLFKILITILLIAFAVWSINFSITLLNTYKHLERILKDVDASDVELKLHFDTTIIDIPSLDLE